MAWWDRFRRRRKKEYENPIAVMVGAENYPTEASLNIGKLRPKDYKKYLEAFKGWVYGAVTIVAETCASIPWGIYKIKGEDKVRLKDHYLYRLFNSVNSVMGWYDLMEITIIHLELAGNAYWYIPRIGKSKYPAYIFPLSPARTKIVPGGKEDGKLIKGYIYEGRDGINYKFTPDEIIHFKYPNPLDPLYYGLPPLWACAYAYNREEYMNRTEEAIFKNYGHIGGVITGVRNDAEAIRIRKLWREAYAGPDKAGRIAVLIGDVKMEKIGLSPRELNFLAGRKMTREEILAVYKVPRAKLGLTDGVNYANAKEQDRTFRKEKVLPVLKRIESKINERIAILFGSDIRFEFDNPVPDDMEVKMKFTEMSLKTGLSTINEQRAQYGLAPVDWGDRPILPLNLLPLPASSGEGSKRQGEIQGGGYIKVKKEKDYDVLWKNFIALQTQLEKRMSDDVRKRFKEEKRIVLRALRSLKSISKQDEDLHLILPDNVERRQRWEEMLRHWNEEGLREGFLMEVSRLGLMVEWSVDYSPIQQYINETSIMIAERIYGNTERDLKAILSRSFSEGLTIPETAKEIEEYFDFCDRVRSMRIARTETISALNYGQHTAMQEGGVTYKIWITALDERVREWHAEAHGQRVLVNQPFTVGGESLMYPGDKTGSPSNIINCRCNITGEVE